MTKSLAVALPLLLLILTVLDVKASTQINRSKWPNISSKLLTHGLKVSTLPFVSVRGGALDGSDDDELDLDDEDEEPEEEEEIEEEELDPVMVKAAIKASHKSKQKQTAAVKAKVSATLATPVTKKKKSNGIIKKIPYIIRACLNPFTVIAMTKAYFASLFNLNYLQEDKSKGLRSALEEKAKKAGPSSGGRKGKRQMKPGQAKTLSDLPQLNT